MSEQRYSHVSDSILLQRIARRDEAAFNELYHRHARKMLNYFYRMLYQNEQLAQDFNQDLWLKIVEKSSHFDPSYPAQTWMYSLASNMCKNEYRKRHVRQEASLYLHVKESSVEDPAMESDMDHQSFQQALDHQLNELSDDHRNVFVLRYQANLPIKEIAQLLDVKEGTIKSRIFYALRQLARHLAAFGPDSNSH